MNPFVFAMRRPVTTFMLVVVLIGGGVFGLNKMRADTYPPEKTPKVYVYLDYAGASAKHAKDYVVDHFESYFHKKKAEEGEAHHEHKVVVTSPLVKDVIITQEYVCLIHSQRNINIQALENGYLEAIPVKEGQSVKKGDLMFKVVPTLYQARLEAEEAEVQLAKYEYENTLSLASGKTQAVSQRAVLLDKARLAKAEAKRKLAEAELNFATIKAPFDGIVGRLLEQEGSLVKEGDMLTTLSDNSVMWVYFNVPEKQYLAFMAETGPNRLNLDVELKLANHNSFPHTGKIDLANKVGAIEGEFNPETGNIAFRADVPNPDRLLRHGQTGTVLVNRLLKDAILIPQRSTFENLAKRYVYVVDKDDIVHQREIVIEQQGELDDVYVIEKRILSEADKIILEGVRQVREGDKVEFAFRDPKDVMKDMKNPAE